MPETVVSLLDPPGAGIRSSLGSLGARFLGVVLLVATWAKSVEPGAFAEQIRLEELDFWFSSPAVVMIALALEAGLGTLLLLGLRRWWVLSLSALLVVFFLYLNGRNYWLVSQGLRDPEAACGCFGTLIERTPAEAFWQDLLLLVPPLLLALWGRKERSPSRTLWRLAAAGVIVLTVTVYAGRSTDLRAVQIAESIGKEVVGTQERFTPALEYLLVRANASGTDAEVYHSDASLSFLLLGSELRSPVLLRLRTGTVETTGLSMIEHQDGGVILISPEAAFQPQGTFQVGTEGIQLEVEGTGWLLTSSQKQS